MGTRTIQLDDDAEATLSILCNQTGLSISEVLKRGLQADIDRGCAVGQPSK